ncbi:MAG: HD domain-containing protein [Butyricicoccus sp.]
MDLIEIFSQAIDYNAGDPRRVQHLTKVWAFSRMLAQAEGLSGAALEMLEAAAILHDIGIHEAERKHGSSAGPYQEQEGPAVARPMLEAAGASAETAEHVCFLIAHHHSPSASDALDFRILLEADFLVNAYEDALPVEACRTAGEHLFRTPTGKQYLQALYLAPPYSPAR